MIFLNIISCFHKALHEEIQFKEIFHSIPTLAKPVILHTAVVEFAYKYFNIDDTLPLLIYYS